MCLECPFLLSLFFPATSKFSLAAMAKELALSVHAQYRTLATTLHPPGDGTRAAPLAAAAAVLLGLVGLGLVVRQAPVVAPSAVRQAMLQPQAAARGLSAPASSLKARAMAAHGPHAGRQLPGPHSEAIRWTAGATAADPVQSAEAAAAPQALGMKAMAPALAVAGLVTIGLQRLLRRALHPPVTSPVAMCPATGEKVSGAASDQTIVEELAASPQRKYFMVSGKGGVGKTSLSASLGVKLAMEGHRVLVVSTDPAHSLGDSLDQDISGGKPVPLEGTDLEIWGMEIDIEAAKKEFQAVASSPKTKEQAEGFLGAVGMAGMMSKLVDLNLAEILNTPPPGFDEGVAISKVIDFVEKEEYAKFTRIVIDTAPTGHTLRLLQLPDFLEASIGKIVRLRRKIGNAGSMLQGIFNLTGADEQLDAAANKLEVWQRKLVKVGDLFRDPSQMEFIIACIPTILSVRESARLLDALREDGVPCRRIICNQMVGDTNADAYVRMKLQAQTQSLKELREAPQVRGLEVIEAPLVDLEVRGVPALQYFGQVVWRGGREAAFADMQRPTSQGPRRFYMLGGKGGVGKTSLSASLAVQFASEGHSTLVVSTDPAHSLGDALAQEIGGGAPVEVVEGNAGLPLYAMEISVEAARAEIQSFAQDGGTQKVEDWLGGVGMGSLAAELKDLQLGELLQTLPPGTDEAIAISKVIEFLQNPKYADFDRIIFDTAPSGHTLRLLSLPDFLDQTIGKILRLRQSFQNATGYAPTSRVVAAGGEGGFGTRPWCWFACLLGRGGGGRNFRKMTHCGVGGSLKALMKAEILRRLRRLVARYQLAPDECRGIDGFIDSVAAYTPPSPAWTKSA